MKKQISLILALIMLLGLLAGCGGGDVGGTISDPANSPENTPKEVKDETEAEDETGAEDEGKEIDLGSISGGAVYTNDFAGLTFALPEGWSFATEEELAEMMSVGAETVFGEDKQKLVEYAIESTVYDMSAYSADLSQNLMVMFENTSRYLLGGLLSAEDYLDALESNFDLVQEFTYVIEGRSDITIGGVEYKCLSTSVEGYGIYQDYVVRREGKYMICIAFTGLEPNPAVTMGEYFS